jgi:major membrane immunogen (membrane-anchored lipoprotein)
MKMFAMVVALGTAFPALAQVSVTAPANNSQVATTVQFVAKATTSCAKGVSAMGIYTAPNVLAYVIAGSALNTELTLNPGTYQTVVQEWDNCGGVSKANVTIIVKGSAPEVQVMAPTNNATVATQVQYIATASTSCPKGVSAMGIYTAPGVLAYVTQGASLNKVLTLNPGTYSTVVQEWDNCGGSATTPVTINVKGQQSGGSVQVSAPANNANVATSVQFVASATTSCSAGVSAMGIYTAPGVLAYKVNANKLNTVLTLTPGLYHTVVQEWDNCGGAATTPIAISVGGAGPAGKTGQFSNLQQMSGWTGYALLPPLYAICDSCKPSGPQTTWSMTQGVSSPSLSGNSARMDIGGQTVYSDGLWNNHLIGDFSSRGLPDTDRSIVPAAHNFTYDVYFYANDISVSQALEFDINQFVNGQSFIWGHECRIMGGHEWDIWDNPGQKWHATGIPCNPVSNSWNHLVIQAQRTSDNHLLFKSITLNGQTATLNYYESPTPTNWYGITINYQQDGNYKQQPYSIWLDKLTFTYW